MSRAHPTSAAPSPARGAPRWSTPPDLTRAVTVGELAAIGAVGVVAALALASLVTAHLRVLTLGSVAVGSIGLLVLLAVLAWWSPGRPRVVLDLPGLVLLAIVGLVAAWFYLPGFHYAAGDRDPGGYVMHAISMARTHAWDVTDPVVRDGLPYGLTLTDPPSRFLGASIADTSTGQTIPLFYHLWPALLATAWNVHGWGGLSNTTPLVAVLSTVVITCLCRRIALRLLPAPEESGTAGAADAASTRATPGVRQVLSLTAAAVGGAILATNMLQVWQAKYPTAELLSQLLFAAATLCLIVAIETRWAWPAGLCGALVAMGYLARADGILIVAALIAFGALVWVAGRFDARGWWCTVGLAIVLPYALWQAYGPAAWYTTANLHVPLRLLLAGIAAAVAGALVLRPLLRSRVPRVAGYLERDRSQLRLGLIIAIALSILFVLGLIRPIFGPDYVDYHGRLIRSYDEITLYRLSWFFTWPGWALVVVGWWVVLVRRWRLSAWVVLVPLAGLLPLYAWHAENSPWLMWWGRRFLPTVLLGVVVLMALAVGYFAALGLQRARALGRMLRVTGAIAALVAASIVVSTGVTSSLPVRSHDEWGGSYDIERALTDLDPAAHAVYLWQPASYCCAPAVTLFGGPLWMIWDQTSVLLPANNVGGDGNADMADTADTAVSDAVMAYVKHFPGEPIYLVYDRGEPPAIPGATVTPVQHFTGTLPRWMESSVTRPASATRIPYNFQVYQVTPD